MQRLLRQFLQLESASSIILLMSAIVAMIWANSSLALLHQQFVDTCLPWINEGLMAIFFLLVGLELKRGYVDGHLSHLSQILLPATAALGGMLIPACLYWVLNRHDAVAVQGWSTPVATDIAFALGVLSLFGKRIPSALKLFLLALAIFDDIGAIIIIALFYSHGLSFFWLCLSMGLIFTLYMLNVLSVRALMPYLFVGGVLWLTLLNSGIHPTIAGVLLALAIPDGEALESTIHPWVAYLIMPLFALANAGFVIQGLSINILTQTVVLGIALGLFIGKQIGVFGFSWLLIKCRFARLPAGSSFGLLYGVALLCGIGFTMSLFLGTLSFQHENAIYLAEVRLGVMIGSLLSALVGAMVLLLVKGSKSVE